MKYSVIIPVYKVEAYLAACVESVLAQTYQNFELILVDDGSPDNCPQMCDAFATRDSRIRVIHKENGGLSSARNAGIDIAKGEQNRFEEVVKDKSYDQLSEEEKSMKQELEQKVSTLTAQRNARLTEIGIENSTVRQLADLALLEAGLLTGEKLTQFIQRSMSMLK